MQVVMLESGRALGVGGLDNDLVYKSAKEEIYNDVNEKAETWKSAGKGIVDSFKNTFDADKLMATTREDAMLSEIVAYQNDVVTVGITTVAVSALAKSAGTKIKTKINKVKTTNRVKANIKASQQARQSSNFSKYVTKENAILNEVTSGKLNYSPTSGVELVTTPGKTTTILGTYVKDTGSIVNELGNVKSTNLGPRQNGFNVLNIPDELYQNPKQFWNEFNQPWLDNAITRNDTILMASKPEFNVGSLFRKNSSGKLELSGFGKEYRHLRKNGYVFDPNTNQMIKK